MTFPATATATRRHCEVGIRYFDRGQYELAVRELTRVLPGKTSDAQPDAALAHFYLGEAYASLAAGHAEKQDWPAAEECLRKALGINPNYPDLHYELARVCFLTDRYGDAAVETSRALAINPSYARAIFLDGLVQYQMSDVDEGLERMLEAARLEPALAGIYLDKALYLHQEAMYEEAATVFAAAGLTCVNEVAETVRLAREQMQNGDVSEARETARVVLEQNPGYPDLHNLMGQIWMAMGEHREAAGEFREAIALNPRYVAAHVHLGHACRRMGNEEAALAAYEMAAALDPANQEARSKLSAD